MRARIEARADSPEGAFNAYQDALALDATSGEALLGVAQLGLQLGRLDEAKEATARMLALDPNQPNALLVAGLIAYVRRRHDEAIDYANRLLERSEFDEGGTILLARTAVMEGRPEEAKAALRKFEEASGVTSGSARTRLEIARFEADPQAMDGAFADLRELSADDTETPVNTAALLIDEANFRFKRGQEGRGLALTKEAIEAREPDPENISTILDIWREYDVGNPGEATLRSIRRNAPPGTRLAVAEYLIDIGQLPAAIAMVTDLKSIEADAVRAQIAFVRGDVGKARREADAILEREKTQCTALVVRAKAMLRMNEPVEARRSSQLATAECPNNIDGWIVTAQAYTKEESIINARRIFRDGVAANPQNTAIARVYADWLIARGADREALAAGRRLVKVAPAASSGWKLYAEICRRLSSDCLADANDGLNKSRERYGIDMKPGRRPENNLFGRFVAR